MRRATPVLLGAAALLAACRAEPRSDAAGAAASGSRARVQRAAWTPLGLGTPASPARIAAWDVDVDTLGHGLPAGRGDAVRGAQVFAQQCAMCHGAKGEGIPPFPALVGREPRQGFPFWQDAKYVKTVGNYWPYATTLYDYVRRAMPYTAPGSLSPDDTYAVVAHLLAANEVIARDAIMDAKTLPAVRMPAHDRFVPDDRAGGPVVR